MTCAPAVGCRTSGFRTAVFLIGLMWLLLTGKAATADIVKVQNPGALPVLDQAGLLTPEQEQTLSAKLKTLATTDGTQVSVLTVPTTGDEDIFTFSQRTAEEWGIGQKENNNGALFVVASQDRKSRIHVGYGLEGKLTDALSKRILSTEVSPEFKEGRFYEGINKGVDSIIAVVKGEYTAPPLEESRGGEGIANIIIIMLILFFLFSALRRGRGGRGGRGGGPGVVLLPNVWTTGGHSSGGWGHSGGDSGGGGFGGGFGGGSFGGGGASDSW